MSCAVLCGPNLSLHSKPLYYKKNRVAVDEEKTVPLSKNFDPSRAICPITSRISWSFAMPWSAFEDILFNVRSRE